MGAALEANQEYPEHEQADLAGSQAKNYTFSPKLTSRNTLGITQNNTTPMKERIPGTNMVQSKKLKEEAHLTRRGDE